VSKEKGMTVSIYQEWEGGEGIRLFRLEGIPVDGSFIRTLCVKKEWGFLCANLCVKTFQSSVKTALEDKI
jgi:hypothetical protein